MAGSVQFKGVDAVMQAFENRKIPAWSIWQGGQFLFKHEGGNMDDSAEILEQHLQMLSESGNAIYTLKVYEDFTGKIKRNTPDDGSFNFRLNLEGQEITLSQYGKLNSIGELRKEIEELKEQLAEKEAEEPKSKFGIIGDILADEHIGPLVAPLIAQIAQKLFSPSSKNNAAAAPQPAPEMQMRPNAIAGIAEDEVKISEALSVLRKIDAKLPEHLFKLAKIATEDRATFNFLLQTLDGIE